MDLAPVVGDLHSCVQDLWAAVHRCRLSGYGLRQPIEQKSKVMPRTPNPTYGVWLV